ncbi:calcium-binding protein [Nocardioides sp.]|uniref:calcium-binding protein n=1 Tax=Nocardioides sp. TaxID=35761 RepID=UPI0026311671|nr:calcium-binding protein [Nocardioides sp.]MCW2738122.1 Hemolysin-type calcium-binding region [Nocardioides sp.]
MSTKRPSQRIGCYAVRSYCFLGSALVLAVALSRVETTKLAPGGAAEVPASHASVHAAPDPAISDPLTFAYVSLIKTAGTDRPTCIGLSASTGGVGTNGDDVIVGTSGRDVIVSGRGNDTIYGRNGKDVICGGPGNDKLVGGRNPWDWSLAKHGDRLAGGAGDDHLIDRWGFRDKLVGGSGNDRLVSSSGTEHKLLGGPGADRLISRDVVDNITIGGRGPDVVTALSGYGYSRYHAGGPGRDILDVGPTGDILVGLTGDGDRLTVHGDAYVVPNYWDSPVGVEVDMVAGTVRRIGGDPTPADVITFAEPDDVSWILYGSTHDDRMVGGEGDDTFFGLRGDDVLIGYGGSDGLNGFQGADVIHGGDGNDYSLSGDQGDDVIDGGEGDDTADGGKGNDTCLNVEQTRRCSP